MPLSEKKIDNPSKKRIENFKSFADQHPTTLPEDYKFSREEANDRIDKFLSNTTEQVVLTRLHELPNLR